MRGAKSIVTSYGRRGKLSRNSKQPIKVKVDTTSLVQTKPRLGQEPVKGPVSRKSRELFWSEKPFVKLRPAYSVKLVFSYVVKEIKIKKTASDWARENYSCQDDDLRDNLAYISYLP